MTWQGPSEVPNRAHLIVEGGDSINTWWFLRTLSEDAFWANNILTLSFHHPMLNIVPFATETVGLCMSKHIQTADFRFWLAQRS